MDTEKNTCRICRWYKPLYTKCYCHFELQKCGLCSKINAPVDKNGNCDKWTKNTETCKRFTRYSQRRATFKILYNISQNLIEVAQIMKEENEENKIDPLPDGQW